MVYKTINLKEFKKEFREFDNSEIFSEDALEVIYKDLDNKNSKLDITEICLDYSEVTQDELKIDYLNLSNSEELNNSEDYEDTLVGTMYIRKLDNGDYLIFV